LQGCLFDDCHVGVRVLPFNKLKGNQYTTCIVRQTDCPAACFDPSHGSSPVLFKQ